jgi:hypothetical protein
MSDSKMIGPKIIQKMAKTSFTLTMFDDDETKEASLWMNDISVMFNHSKNILPDEYYQMQDGFPIGSKVKVTFEILN